MEINAVQINLQKRFTSTYLKWIFILLFKIKFARWPTKFELEKKEDIPVKQILGMEIKEDLTKQKAYI